MVVNQRTGHDAPMLSDRKGLSRCPQVGNAPLGYTPGLKTYSRVSSKSLHTDPLDGKVSTSFGMTLNIGDAPVA